jgi:hypothetical protein
MIEHAVTKAMVQSTFVPSLISIEAFIIISYQFELVTGGFSMKTAIFCNMLMRKRLNESSSLITEHEPRGVPL